MRDSDLEALARQLLDGKVPDDVQTLRNSPVRTAVLYQDVFLKVSPRRPAAAAREARNLRRAHRDGLPVPEYLAHGPGWIASRRIDGLREARREDLPAILELADRMHGLGWIHGDFHLGNLAEADGQLLLLDLQKSRRWPVAPGWLRRRDLGFLAFSLGEPLPEPLEAARRARDRRAHGHWRSRTRRCLKESSGFTAWQLGGARGFRSRAVGERELEAALAGIEGIDPLKQSGDARVYRRDGWVLKSHASRARARAAWIGGHGLEMRGVPTGRAVAWLDRWVVMRDAGATLIDWIDRDFEQASAKTRLELADQLGELMGRLHRRGIYHPDLKANNLAWTPGSEPRLLDYGRVRFGRRVARRRRVKNLAQLNAALPDQVPAELRARALTAYLAASGAPDDAGRLRADVVVLSLRRGHRWSGCSPSGSTSCPTSPRLPPRS